MAARRKEDAERKRELSRIIIQSTGRYPGHVPDNLVLNEKDEKTSSNAVDAAEENLWEGLDEDGPIGPEI